MTHVFICARAPFDSNNKYLKLVPALNHRNKSSQLTEWLGE
jgi:hypothetical protein